MIPPRRRWWRRRRLRIGGVLVVLACGVYLHGQYVPPILMYHRIDDQSATSGLSVSPDSFARQMAFLYRHGHRVVPLRTITDWIVNDKLPERGAVAITFDDGFESVYTQAYPVLRQHGLPATVFIVTNWVGTPGYLSWKQIRELAASGLFEIGSHSRTHPWLPAVDEQQLNEEITGSRRILEAQLPGIHVMHFSYPMGAYDATVKHNVREAAYESACATNPGRYRSWRDRYALKRLRISRSSDNLLVFWIETSGYYTWIKEHRGKHLLRPRPLETAPSGQEA